jgi:23S rRNA pseudouridine955/2504/2580 synthase
MTQASSKRRPKHEIIKLSKADDEFIRSFLIYEDSDILVFNKPSGLAVQGGSGVSQDVDRLLCAFATRKGRRPKLVHRLDRQTSGVLVVAKTSPAAAHLSDQFARRTTQKLYQALCSGVPEAAEGTIDAPLVRHVDRGLDLMRIATSNDTGAQSATTMWRVIDAFQSACLIEASPQTGRMHQIRVHLAALGHPIAGDVKYGGLLALGGIMVPRLMLHASRLEFVHPASGERMRFDAPLPPAFTAALASLGG